MKTKTILFFSILLLAVLYSGSSSAQRLVIWQKDGSKVNFDLNERPKTTFTAEDLIITTATAAISYPLAIIQRYTYEGGALSVQNVKADGIRILHKGDNVIVKGLTNGKSITVYSIDGKQLKTKRSDGSDCFTLSLANLPLGVYMIKADEITYKILKR